MKFHLTFLTAAALAAAPALAQTQSGSDTASAMPAGKQEAAQSYVDSQAMQTALDELLSTETFVAQLQASGVQLDQTQTQTLAEIVDEEFADVRGELEEAMSSAAADAFTMEELEALNDFYGSDEGQSIAAKMQPFMQSFYQEIGPTLRETQSQIAMRAEEALSPAAEGQGDSGTVTE